MAEASKMREEKPVASSQAPEASAATATSPTSGDKSSSHSPNESKTPEIGEPLLERLARQVEYYFSSANLSKDTYVSTLRSLNDGYVPVSIIANFGKVKSLVQYDAFNAVKTAATEFSELLEVVEIDTQTGKRVKKDESNSSDAPVIEAVGPISGEPIPISVIPAAPTVAPVVKPPSAVQNTVIIREVPEGTEESHIRQLFTFENCPAIESLHLDVANCWFVTLNTTSRDDMVNVMFELRKMKFPSGQPVLARLKSGVVLSAVSQPFVPAMYPPQSGSPDRYNNGSRKNKKKKNNNNGNAKSRSGGNVGNQNKNGKGKNSSPRSRNNAGKQQKKPSGQQWRQNSTSQEAPVQQTPPTLGEEHFPTLPTDDLNSKKIEVEKVPDHAAEDDSSCDELGKAKAHSDSASTATTSTSSSSSKHSPQQQTVGGYAAALKKAAPPKPEPVKKPVEKPVSKTPSKKETNSKKSSEGQKPKPNKETTKKENKVDSVGVQPPSWGGGRTFADLLRKESMGSTSEQAV